MLKKRLIGVVTVRQGWAVQSFSYNRYLPLGRAEVLVENLDRWGADEILIQCIDRSKRGLGPNFSLLARIGELGLSTPLIYGGGIRNAEDAVKLISLGADRVMVDAVLRDSAGHLQSISRELGTQAIVAHMPVRLDSHGLHWLNYRDGTECLLGGEITSAPALEWVSEVMLTDWQHEGIGQGFDEAIPSHFPIPGKPLLVFGGLSEPDQILRLMGQPRIVAAGVGNFLSYKEHAVQAIKRRLAGVPVRGAHYLNEHYSS